MTAARSQTTKLGVDAMLGSLARKLRAFGFDSVYFKDQTDSAIVAACRRQGRVLVTADRELAARARRVGLAALLTSGETDRARVASMVKEAQGVRLGLRRGGARCSLCNGRLATVSRARAGRLVPSSVSRRHRSFFRCAGCGQLYWKGGHWKKLRRLEALFKNGS